MCWVKATFKGEPGHGSLPRDDSAVLKLSRALAGLSGKRLPMHPTTAVRAFVEALARELPLPQRAVASTDHDPCARLAHPRSAHHGRLSATKLRGAPVEHRHADGAACRGQDERDPGTGFGRDRRPNAPGADGGDVPRGAARGAGQRRGSGGHRGAPVDASGRDDTRRSDVRAARPLPSQARPGGHPHPLRHPRLHRRQGIRSPRDAMLRLRPGPVRPGR